VGGGVFNSSYGHATIDNSYIVNNTATSNGGGIYNRGYAGVSGNSTIADNTTYGIGGGAWNSGA